MKTKIIIFSLLLISLSMSAQIKLPKKNNLSIKPKATLKLPLLKAKSARKHQEFSLDNLKFFATIPKLIPYTAEVEPKPYSTLPNTLNITLTAKNLRYSNAGLMFIGRYDHNGTILIDKWSEGSVRPYFKAKRNKTYRIKVKFDLDYKKYCKSRMKLFVNVGSSLRDFNIEKGANSLDFLIHSEVEGEISFGALAHYYIYCGDKPHNDDRLICKFKSVKIQELQD